MTFSSIRLKATPTWPTSVCGLGSITLSAKATSPESRLISATREAVAVTRRSGRNASWTINAPSSAAMTSPITLSAVMISVRRTTVELTGASGNPVTTLSEPPCDTFAITR